MIQEKKRYIKPSYIYLALISIVYQPSCTTRTSRDDGTNQQKKCEALFKSIFDLNRGFVVSADYLDQFPIDSNTFDAYIIYPVLNSNKEEHFECKKYIINQTDFILSELDRDGIYFCIDSNNTTFYFGKMIDPKKVEYSINFFLHQWYKEIKNKSSEYIYNDSINIRIDVKCSTQAMLQPSFDWDNFWFIINVVYHSLQNFRQYIIEDTYGTDLYHTNEIQLEVINRFYNPLIYIEHSDGGCMSFELPKPMKAP
ncbi:MAG: hypothetical protein H6546_00760 [Chitinophagales bacterium]|nr:hypothetical protein [Flavobacteriaceae bacterium]MCB0538483.1 hypothetical protein [Bacteroidota bacterium]MCB9018841.1 hypothetical protein [Chitinophagales bacterium]